MQTKPIFPAPAQSTDALDPARYGLPPDLALRPMTAADLPFLRALYVEVNSEPGAALPAATQLFLSKQFDALHAQYRNHYPGARLMLVCEHNMPIGQFFVHESAQGLHLIDIALQTQQRGRGIGGVLLAALLDDADRHGLRVSLHVEGDNPARRLYTRLGFVQVSGTDTYARLERVPLCSAG